MRLTLTNRISSFKKDASFGRTRRIVSRKFSLLTSRNRNSARFGPLRSTFDDDVYFREGKRSPGILSRMFSRSENIFKTCARYIKKVIDANFEFGSLFIENGTFFIIFSLVFDPRYANVVSRVH